MNLLAVDDEPAALRYIVECAQHIADIESVVCETDPIRAKLIIEQNPAPDIVILDIQIKGFNGLGLAEAAMGRSKIIFSTAHENYALASYDYNAVDYLLKPYSPEKFVAAIDKCRKLQSASEGLVPDSDRFVALRDTNAYRNVKLDKSKVFYIECQINYTKVFMEDNSFIMPNLSLVKLLSILEPYEFIKVHKSYAVQLSKVKALGITYVELSNKSIIKIGRKYKPLIRQYLDSKKGI